MNYLIFKQNSFKRFTKLLLLNKFQILNIIYIIISLSMKNIMLVKILFMVLLDLVFCQDEKRREVFLEFGLELECFQLFKLTKQIQNGFYIDIGGFDPYTFSNSFCQYLRGWKGIVVEPNPQRMSRFFMQRSRQIHLNLAVGQPDQYLELYEAKDGRIATVNKNLGESDTKYTSFHKKMKVSSLTLAQICQRYYLKRPDIMNIGLHAYKREILNSNNWQNQTCVPDIIIIDSDEQNENQSLKKSQQFLLSKKYIVINELRQKKIFIRSQISEQYNQQRLKTVASFYKKVQPIIFTHIIDLIRANFRVQTTTFFHYDRKTDGVNYHYVVDGQPVFLERINYEDNKIAQKKNRLIIVLNFNNSRSHFIFSHSNFTTQIVRLDRFTFQKFIVNSGNSSFTAIVLNHGIESTPNIRVLVLQNEEIYYKSNGFIYQSLDQISKNQISQKNDFSQVLKITVIIVSINLVAFLILLVAALVFFYRNEQKKNQILRQELQNNKLKLYSEKKQIQNAKGLLTTQQ